MIVFESFNPINLDDPLFEKVAKTLCKSYIFHQNYMLNWMIDYIRNYSTSRSGYQFQKSYCWFIGKIIWFCAFLQNNFTIRMMICQFSIECLCTCLIKVNRFEGHFVSWVLSMTMFCFIFDFRLRYCKHFHYCGKVHFWTIFLFNPNHKVINHWSRTINQMQVFLVFLQKPINAKIFPMFQNT